MTLISKLITCIRNAKNAKLSYITYSINKEERILNLIAILTILRNNGVIRAFSYLPSNNNKNKFVIYIKYDQVGNNVIRSIFNVSKPSRKLYISSKSL
jgi:ribosomal protein S8